MPGRSDRQYISEEHVARLCGVARSTRQEWAADGLVGQQTSPYTLIGLQEVVALRHLRRVFGVAAAGVAWRQLRMDFESAYRAGTFELVVDLYSLRSQWVETDDTILIRARSGHAVHVVDLERLFKDAEEGFHLAARPGKGAAD